MLLLVARYMTSIQLELQFRLYQAALERNHFDRSINELFLIKFSRFTSIEMYQYDRLVRLRNPVDTGRRPD